MFPTSPRRSPKTLSAAAHRRSRNRRRLAALATLGLTGIVAGLLSGCANGITDQGATKTSTSTPASSTPTSTPQYTAASGNWLFTTSASRLRSFSGSLSVNGSAVTGTLHPLAGTCFTAVAPFAVSGSIAQGGLMTLTSSNFSGGAVSISGTLAADQHSLTNPVITVTGGACTSANATTPTLQPRDTGSGNSAQQYQALTGTYTGTLTSDFGGSLALSVAISQGASPDSSGNYHLTGTSTFAGGGCVGSPNITDSVVSGNTVSTTYTDPNTGASVTGTGTFSADAQTLTISTWTLSGNCGSDHGSGILTRH